jgi:hypothetical protein
MFQICENISPYIERVEGDYSDNLVDDIVTQYSTIQQEEEVGVEEAIQQPEVTCQEALLALDTLRRYEEQNNNGDIQLLKLLHRRERELSSSQFNSKQQAKLSSWLQRG